MSDGFNQRFLRDGVQRMVLGQINIRRKQEPTRATGRITNAFSELRRNNSHHRGEVNSNITDDLITGLFGGQTDFGDVELLQCVENFDHALVIHFVRAFHHDFGIRIGCFETLQGGFERGVGDEFVV